MTPCLGEAQVAKRNTMSYTNLLYHIVIRTKRSEPTIPIDHERDLYMYFFTFIKAYDCRIYRIGGMPDHIHLLVSMRSTLCLADFMRDMKTATSKFMKSHKEDFPMFDRWESEYFACTVSPGQKDAVIEYIKNQKEHHKGVNSRDEILRLCRENGIEVEERYI